MKIPIFGTGYVAPVQGAVLAEAGHDVLCIIKRTLSYPVILTGVTCIIPKD